MMNNLSGALRLAVFSMIVCCAIYTLAIWGFAQLVTPGTANGHLIRNQAGIVVGSRQIAQKFNCEKYFHNRPSAVDYNGAGAGGSNLSPASAELRKQAQARIAANGATAARPLPTDLATASGSGLDPHITLPGAEFQIARVAAARGLSPETVGNLVKSSVSYPGGFLKKEPIVNVLELNLKLDNLN